MNRQVLILIVLYLLSIVQCISALPTTDPAVDKKVTAPGNNSTRSEKEHISLEDTVRLITDGESKIKLEKNIKDVVLVVGMTGAGKTTITKFISQAENLEAYKAGTRYLIRDKDKEISEGSTVISKTIFPNLIVDQKSGISFYDMPGFSDTRNVSVEIANAWFLKNVADHAERVKILLIVTHSTMTHGGHRKKILELLNHVTDFIKNPAKFKNSISLVASKVNLDDTPERIIGGVADFLKNVKSSLRSVMSDAKRREKTTEVLDALLSKSENNEYNRISYFLQPSTAGPLTEQADVMERRDLMVRNLEVGTRFVTNSPDDFGISVSDNGKLLITKVAGVMNEMISTAMVSLSNQIVKYTQSSLNNPSMAVGKLLTDQKQLDNFYHSLSPTMSRQEFTQALYQLITTLNIPGLDQEIQTIENREKNLNFFETVRGERFPPNILQWASPLRIAIESTNSALTTMTSSLNHQMVQEAKNLNNYFQNKIHQLIFNSKNSTSLKQQISSLYESLEGLIEDARNRVETYNQFAALIRTFLSYQGDMLRASKIRNLTNDIGVEGPNCRAPSSLKISNWLPPFQILLIFLQEENTKVEKMILNEIFHPILNELKLAKNEAEKNFTQLFTEEDHSISVLRTQQEQEEKVFEDRMVKLEENCERDLSNFKSLYDHEEHGLTVNGDNEEEIFKKELALEKENTGRVEEHCSETINQLNATLEDLRQQNVQNLEDERQRRKELSDNLEKQLAKQLQEKQSSCLKEIQNKKLLCAQQQADLQKHSDQQAQTMESKVSRRNVACQEDVKSVQSICAQEATILKEQTEADQRLLENKITVAETNCETQKKVELEACNDQKENAKADLESEELRARNRIASITENCELELETKATLHSKEVEILKNKMASEKSFLQEDCKGRVHAVEAQASKDFEKQKEEYLQRWKKSGSCCYAQGGLCRDGTEGTPCCAPTSCEYKFLESRCCGCSSQCRMAR